ncbi:MAG: FtsX-like permease family protein, partial [Saprospiraceae bacterium]|nr:FtsX-like permease family protein [Saprospiraceae bacterium]
VDFTDPAFFQLFNFPLVAGTNDLSDKNSVLLTEKTAEKYFGKNDPIGKTLVLYAGDTRSVPLTVRGVLKNVPLNSSFRFGLLTHFENLKTSDTSFVRSDDWKWMLDAVIFRIPNPADAAHLEAALKKYLPQQNAARPDWKVTGFRLLPFSTMADQTADIQSNGLYNRPDDAAAYGPFVIAGLIFLSACLNFANTTVARSNRRLREMGVRKALGGTRFQLMRQVLLECGVVVLAALLLSLTLNNWWLHTYNQMFEGISLGADYAKDPSLLRFMAGILLFTTLLAGAYPAFYISNFNASQIFRGGVKFGGTNLFSRLLLGVQVMVSLITVVAGIAFARNANFQKNYDYGYERSGLMGVRWPGQQNFTAFRDAVQTIPGVESVAGTRSHIGFGYRTPTAESEGQKHEVNLFDIGENYLDVMALRLIEGRALDPNREADLHESLLITQKTAAEFGWSAAAALGKRIRIDTVDYAVVGVLHNFHQEHLFEPLKAQAMRLTRPDQYFNMIIKAQPSELKAVHDQVKAKWAQMFPLQPFFGFYQDQVGAEALRVTTSIATLFSWFAVVAILLTATGLFALVSLTVLKKMKEIALRKVVGARMFHIMHIVNRGYFWIFVVAAALGCYAGWFFTRFLMDNIFKINVGVEPLTLLMAVIALFGISALIVGVKVRQAVSTNPADVLRSE